MYNEGMEELLNISSRFDVENIYICELHVKLTSNVINIFIYNIKKLI